jgi:hypothetical protein
VARLGDAAYLRPMMFQVEFFHMIAGRYEPAIDERINVQANHLDDVIRRAMSLPRPAQSTGLQIRENNGPGRHTVTF